ncbi:T9SS type A sorting domain-containing protein, partial [bacterium]|nr:T9SS type A sorting domain-containing protein [bacterium]
DDNVKVGRSYYYKLAAEDCQGNMEFHESVLASAATSVPGTCGLMPNYPNPFNASTVIGYQLPVSGHVTLTIYDVLGRKVRTLLNAHREAGNYTARWDSKDDRGGELKSGVYFCVFEIGDFSQTRRMVLTR